VRKPTSAKIATATEQLRKAERQLEKAREGHRQAFRKALVALFNEYGLQVEANGSEGARLEISELRGTTYKIGDLPE
jgi:hypothetical protein